MSSEGTVIQKTKCIHAYIPTVTCWTTCTHSIIEDLGLVLPVVFIKLEALSPDRWEYLNWLTVESNIDPDLISFLRH